MNKEYNDKKVVKIETDLNKLMPNYIATLLESKNAYKRLVKTKGGK